ncbi:mitofusin [Coemansia sp. RSA 2322]|nr:mitofusin [Coemansia sp. RSA 2322]
MERSLRAFALEQRFKSKLAPAQRYAMNVLGDVQYVAAESVAAATRRIQQINAQLRESLPRYETLLVERAAASRTAEAVLDDGCLEVRRHTAAHLANATLHLQDVADKVPYAGLLALWAYAERVLLAMVRHLEHEVAECDRFACFAIQQARTELSALDVRRRGIEGAPSPHDASEELLPPSLSPDMSVELPPVGTVSNALDSAQLELSDFVDLDLTRSWGALTSLTASASLALLASKSVAAHALALLRLSSAMGTHTARRVMVASAVLIGAGSVLYVVSDMDATVRRNLSARLSLMLDDEGFAARHAERLATEASRAVRPFVWHLQHSFQRMVEAEELRRADHLRRRHAAQDSQVYFDELRIKAHDLANAVRAVGAADSTDAARL